MSTAALSLCVNRSHHPMIGAISRFILRSMTALTIPMLCLLAIRGAHLTTGFQGGTFEGIRQRLDYIKNMGFRALWLSPVLKNCTYNPYSYHGYGIQNFLAIEPRFSSNPVRARKDPRFVEMELERLVDEAHARVCISYLILF